jgi:uncharacterized protein (DUF58 family)
MFGDDVRSIDWNVSARAGEPHVKVFREERELTVMLAVDLSRSLAMGTRSELKRELVAEIAATLAFSAIRSNDRVGMLLFTDRIEAIVPPKKGARHVLRIVRDLLAFTPQGRGTDIARALDELNASLSKRTVVCVISDFLAPAQAKPWEGALARLRRRHDVIPIIVTDARERELPDVGIIDLEDLETGEVRAYDTSSRWVREGWAEVAEDRAQARDRLFRKAKTEPLLLETGVDFLAPLRAYFSRREARRSR